MAEFLDQREINALLSAIDEGQIDGEAFAADETSNVVLYDFRRPERVSKEDARALEALHDGVARSLGASVSSLVRTIVDVRLASVEQSTYGEFIVSLPNPTCFYLLEAEALKGNLILELDPGVVFPILDRMLGGGREPPTTPERPVTEIEQRLIDRVVDRALDALAESWRVIQEVELTVVQKETNPQLVQVLPASEVVVVITYEMTFGEATGTIHQCVPVAVFEPIMNRISRTSRLDYLRRGADGGHAHAIARAIERAPMDLTVYLAETTITVDDLANLRVGDVLKTDKPVNETLLLTVNGKPKMRGRAGQHRGRKALLISETAGPRDRV